MPPVRWKDLCLDAGDPSVAAGFWAPLLGLDARAHHGDDVTCLRGEPAERTLWVNRVPEPKTVKNRVHLDLVRDSVDALVTAGATVRHTPEPGWDWHVLADPEGNELCVFRSAPRDWSQALVVDANDAVAIATWWADLLGARLVPGPDGALRWLADVPGLPYDRWKFVAVPEPKTVKNRWHWDVVCDDVPALVAGGATVLRTPDDDIDWHVLADPEGNEFCAFASS